MCTSQLFCKRYCLFSAIVKHPLMLLQEIKLDQQPLEHAPALGDDVLSTSLLQPETISCSSSSAPAASVRGRATLKRKAKTTAEHILSDADVTADDSTVTRESAVVLTDANDSHTNLALARVHNDHDYTMKAAKRPCLLPLPDTVAKPKIPIQEKTVTQSAPCTSKSKDEKYIERRTKNNIASKRSRKTRKEKFVSMEERADNLVIENKELAQKIVKMEALAKAMKEALVKKMASK